MAYRLEFTAKAVEDLEALTSTVQIRGNRLLKFPITPYRLIIKFRFNSLALTSR